MAPDLILTNLHRLHLPPRHAQWTAGNICPHSSRSQLAQRLERRAQLSGEELWLLPCREVTAPVDLMEVDQVAIGASGPGLRSPIDVLRKDRDAHRDRDLGGLLP